MKAVFISKKKIYTINLPKNIHNSYWITDEDKKIIKINENRRNLEINSNNYAKIINPKYIKILNNTLKILKSNENIFAEKTVVKEKQMYAISMGKAIYNIGIFYCTDENCNSYVEYEIKNTKNIKIGASDDNNIIYKKVLVSDFHAEIYKKEDNTWYIKNYDKNYGTFVNNIPIYDNEKKIFNGDTVFIMGLKFILVNDNIYINTGIGKVNLDSKFLYKKPKERINIHKDYDDNEETIEVVQQEDYFFRGPRLTALIKKEKLKIDPPPELKDEPEKPMFLLMGSSIAMAIVMLLSLSNTITRNNYWFSFKIRDNIFFMYSYIYAYSNIIYSFSKY